MSHHKSLVAFTLLVQSAIGSIWCVAAILSLGGRPFHHEWYFIVAFLAVLSGLGFSLGHLGRPAICFYAVKNLRHSWVSREIAATVAFTGVLVAIVLTNLVSGSSRSWIILTGSIVGILVLFIMARAYRLRTIPSWNHKGTLLSFLSSTLLLGGLQFALISLFLPATSVADCDGTELCLSRHVGFIVALLGLVIKIGIKDTNHSQKTKSVIFVALWPTVLQWCGAVCWAFSIITENSNCIQWSFLLLAALLFVIGEIAQRKFFYDSYRRAGL